jgi:hypothetical protein
VSIVVVSGASASATASRGSRPDARRWPGRNVRTEWMMKKKERGEERRKRRKEGYYNYFILFYIILSCFNLPNRYLEELYFH